MDETLLQQIKPVIRRVRFRRAWATLGIAWFALSVIVVVLTFSGYFDFMLPNYRVILIAAASMLVSLFAWLIAFAYGPSFGKIGRLIEQQYPDLDSRLMTAIEMRPGEGRRYDYLQQDVLRQAYTHSLSHHWTRIVPRWQLILAPIGSLLALTLLVAATLSAKSHVPPMFANLVNFSSTSVDASKLQIQVEPGNTEVERNSSLLIVAQFDGGIPAEVTLEIEPQLGDVSLNGEDVDSQRIRQNMKRQLDDPVFSSKTGTIKQPIRYRIHYDGISTQWYEVEVFDLPRLERADAIIEYPAYTKLSPKTVIDVQRISAVEGSEISLDLHLNRPVSEVLFQCTQYGDQDAEAHSIYSSADAGQKCQIKFRLDESCQFELHLTDSDGRENRFPARFHFTAVPNQTPLLKILQPTGDLEVSALEEMATAAEVWDDFGVVKVGLTLSRPDREPVEIELGSELPGQARHLAEHLVAMEDLDVKADDLVSYFYWADDLDRDGNPRRVVSDIFFAEVRPFDQIFRQGQQPTAGQMQQQGQNGQSASGQNAQQAAEMAEQQKQIIAATWNLIRRQERAQPKNLRDDVLVIRDAQSEVLSQVEEMTESVTDPQSLVHVQSATDHGAKVLTELGSAADAVSSTDNVETQLRDALASEQSLYQDLLRLREREFEVVRSENQQSQQSQSSSNANSRAQQQMQQLNLTNDENRYEDQRTANANQQQDQQTQEDRQVLNRLKELAQRQKDLVEKINELQSALQEENSPEMQEEIQRRLKSLQEQQRDLLRDADELAERMQQGENQQRMSEQANQLGEAREQMQQASEALQNDELTQAAAEGSRAENELNQLKDEFQRRTSSQFSETMQQMRQEAREIEKEQQNLLDQMQNGQQEISSRPTLREETPEQSLVDQLTRQQQRVEQLRNQMQETIEEAETTEPLLAENLYDTYRQSELDRPDRQLQSAAETWERGWEPEAATQLQQATRSLEKMREGIETAAESILGDEIESLRAARENLEQLQRDVEGELQANQDASGQPQTTGSANPTDRQPNQNPSGEKRSDENLADEGTPDNLALNSRQQSGDSNQKEDSSEANSSDTQQDPNQQDPNQQEQPGEGQQQSQQQGQAGEGQQPEEQQGQGQPGQGQPGQGQPGQGQQGQGQQGQGQQGQGQQGQGQQGQSGGDSDANGQRQASQAGESSEQPQQNLLDRLTENGNGFAPNRSGDTGNVPVRSPFSGQDYRQWVDQLRDVEEMISDPELRAEAARIREEAREIRRDLQRHSDEPNWDLIRLKVSQPLNELRQRVAEEILRRTSNDDLVPTDRDPVPNQYRDAVQKYYQRLGIGK